MSQAATAVRIRDAGAALARRRGFREVRVHERRGRLAGEWNDPLIAERLLGEAAAGTG